jgi:hypothetical protein
MNKRATPVPKPVSAATRAMLDEMAVDSSKPASEDKLEACRTKLVTLRDKQREKQDLEERIKVLNTAILEITQRELVDLMQDAKIDKLGLPATGNWPAFDVELDDYYHAVIPKENEQLAYKHLEKVGMEDLIKTTFTISFGLGEGKRCQAFLKKLEKLKEPFDVKQGVPWNSLTAYIKGEYKAGRPLTEKVKGLLGATVGRIVKVKPQKKDQRNGK